MAGLLKRIFPFALVVATSAWIAFRNISTGDYPADGGLAVEALAGGDLSEYLATHVMMGPFATLIQAPFAAVAGGGELDVYRWACLPCLLAVGLLGLYLGNLGKRRGVPAAASWLIAGLCLVNPLTFAAIELGHPEELLTGALAVAAVAVAWQGHGLRAALFLGLAVASKQWAVIAILPTLMALPERRLRAALVAGVVAVLLYLPGFVASPSAFSEVQENAASTGRIVAPWSVWYPLASVEVKESTIGSTRYSAEIHRAPAAVGVISHPLIVLLVFAVPLGLALRRRRFGLSGPDAMALLALLALLRCALDPVGNLYYHLPLLLALIGWDALEARRWPLRSLVGSAVLLMFDHWSQNLGDVALFNLAYIVVAVSAAAVVALVLFRPAGAGQGASATLDGRLRLVA
ncbi:MAG TPA: glycosyltransferase 87 family protein [Solirubrobacterales bacterium]|nr:glycosyltransferase 87 family protein [Solirubrobacterales bacterium]